MRSLPLEERKARLRSLLVRSKIGIVNSDHVAGNDGISIFKATCEIGLEGIVSSGATGPTCRVRASTGLRSRIRTRRGSGDLLKVDTVSRSHRARVNSVTIASPHRTIALRTKKAATTSAPKRRPAFRGIASLLPNHQLALDCVVQAFL